MKQKGKERDKEVGGRGGVGKISAPTHLNSAKDKST